jgi:hypothetical protein
LIAGRSIEAIGRDVVKAEALSPTVDDDGPDDTAFWLAMANVPHIGPVRIERMLKSFGTLRDAWSAPRGELRAVLEARPLSELIAARSVTDPHRELSICW